MKYIKVSPEIYYRNRRAVELSCQPEVFTEEGLWWSNKRSVLAGTSFTCALSDYENPKPIIEGSYGVQVARGELIESLIKGGGDIDTYETLWPDAPEDFLKDNYRVFRVNSHSEFVNLNKSTTNRFPRPDNPEEYSEYIVEPDFLENSPKVIRIDRLPYIYIEPKFYKEIGKLN